MAPGGIDVAMSRVMFRALIASLIAVLPACTTDGFRAEDGRCPSGEVCSDATPTGLRFSGSRFSGDELPGVSALSEKT